MANTLHFGSPVEVRAVLRRESRPASFGYFKFWDRKELKQPRRALYIGKRTLANGGVFYGGSDGVTFTHKEKVTALLVVFNEHEKPVYVLPDDVIEGKR